MTIAYLCIIIMIFVPLFCVAYAKFFGKRGYDNRNPREFLASLEGKAKRAVHAQINTFEAFPPFVAGVLVAQQMHAPQNLIDLLAVSFVCVRVIYVYLYIYDSHLLRSAVWFIGLFLTLALFFIGI